MLGTLGFMCEWPVAAAGSGLGSQQHLSLIVMRCCRGRPTPLPRG